MMRKGEVDPSLALPKDLRREPQAALALRRVWAAARPIPVRSQQRIAPRIERRDDQYLVDAGIVGLISKGSADRPRVLTLFFADDVIASSHVPFELDCGLKALTNGQIRRISLSAFAESIDSDCGSRQAHSIAIARNIARAYLITVLLGELDAAARIAATLLMCALSTGRSVSQGAIACTCLSRMDIAAFTGINADTVSRILVRFEDDHLIRRDSRQALAVLDINRLTAATPVGGAVHGLYGPLADL